MTDDRTTPRARRRLLERLTPLPKKWVMESTAGSLGYYRDLFNQQQDRQAANEQIAEWSEA